MSKNDVNVMDLLDDTLYCYFSINLWHCCKDTDKNEVIGSVLKLSLFKKYKDMSLEGHFPVLLVKKVKFWFMLHWHLLDAIVVCYACDIFWFSEYLWYKHLRKAKHSPIFLCCVYKGCIL